MAQKRPAARLRYPKELPTELRPPDPESPRGRILAAARTLFAERGLDGTSTRDIAETADVNLAMIHYYFGNKEKLYERTLAGMFVDMREMVIAAVAAETRPVEALMQLPIRMFGAMRANPPWAVLLRREMADGGRRLLTVFRDLGEYGPLGLREHFVQIYMEGVKAGAFRDLPVEAVREFLTTLAFGTMAMQPLFHGLFQRDFETEAVWREWSETVGSIIQHGLLTEKK